MAGMVMNAMVARRTRLLKEEYEGRFHELAKTLYDTNQNMQGAKTTIEHIVATNQWGMDIDDAFNLSETARNLGVQSEICAAAIRNVIQDTPAQKKSDETDDDDFDTAKLTEAYDRIVNPTTDVQKLFDNVNRVVANFPLKYNVKFELDKSVPKFIVVEDLLVFRAVLNVILYCMGAAEGSTSMQIRKSKKSNDLWVQCVTGGALVPAKRKTALFTSQDSLLAPVASIVRTLGGRYGLRDGKWEGSDTLQSIFWLQIPYSLSESVAPAANRFTRSQRKVHQVGPGKVATNPKIVDIDPFQAALLEAGCGRRS
jgi:hypothetical protein